MVIWAKLTQGNDRGTCCWITHINVLAKVIQLKLYYMLPILLIYNILRLRCVALRGCLDVKQGKI